MKCEYLKFEEREIIEAMYAKGAKPCDIAKRVGKCQATIYRELERGKTGEIDSLFRPEYNAAVAETRVNQSFKNRGRRKKQSDIV
jgi:IS30 family transposase